jgi:hypothetical protein
VSCEARRDQILLRVGDALDPAEQTELDRHLATGCPRCAGALAEAEAVLAHLGLALSPVAPPASARDRLLARVANYRDRRARAELGALRAPAPARGRTRLRSGLVAAGSAAAGALLLFGALRFGGEDASQALERELSERAAEIAALERSIVDASSALDVLRASKLRVISLAGPAHSGRGSARIYWDWRTGGCYLYATNVRVPPPGHVYQLWFTNVDEQPIPGGVIDVKPTGEATLLTRMPMDIDLFGDVFITLERAAKSDLPSGALVLSGRLEQR